MWFLLGLVNPKIHQHLPPTLVEASLSKKPWYFIAPDCELCGLQKNSTMDCLMNRWHPLGGTWCRSSIQKCLGCNYSKIYGHRKTSRSPAGLASQSNWTGWESKERCRELKASHWIKKELQPQRKHLIVLFFVFTPVDMSLSKLHWEIVQDREGWHAAVYGVTKSRTQLNNNDSN